MIQVWLLDQDGFFTGESIFVSELGENMTTEPLLVGHIKAKWTGEQWVEGATDDEVEQWKSSLPLPSKPSKTNEELEQENKILNAQVDALITISEFHEELIAEMAMRLYA